MDGGICQLSCQEIVTGAQSGKSLPTLCAVEGGLQCRGPQALKVSRLRVVQLARCNVLVGEEKARSQAMRFSPIKQSSGPRCALPETGPGFFAWRNEGAYDTELT